MAFGAFGIWLGGYLLSRILVIDPWVLSPEIPVAASQLYLDCPEPPNRPKSPACAVQANLPRFPDGTWKHAVSPVPRGCASGRGNTSSRTPVGDCENGTKLSVGSAEAPWTSLFLPCVASPAIPSATFNGVGVERVRTGNPIDKRRMIQHMIDPRTR